MTHLYIGYPSFGKKTWQESLEFCMENFTPLQPSCCLEFRGCKTASENENGNMLRMPQRERQPLDPSGLYWVLCEKQQNISFQTSYYLRKNNPHLIITLKLSTTGSWMPFWLIQPSVHSSSKLLKNLPLLLVSLQNCLSDTAFPSPPAASLCPLCGPLHVTVSWFFLSQGSPLSSLFFSIRSVMSIGVFHDSKSISQNSPIRNIHSVSTHQNCSKIQSTYKRSTLKVFF